VATVNVLDVYDAPTAALLSAIGAVSADADIDGTNVNPPSMRTDMTPIDMAVANFDLNDRIFM
jgi:hypothetical protein